MQVYNFTSGLVLVYNYNANMSWQIALATNYTDEYYVLKSIL